LEETPTKDLLYGLQLEEFPPKDLGFLIYNWKNQSPTKGSSFWFQVKDLG
jgi:hypothetical protein